MGPAPIDIILKRIDHYLNNKNNESYNYIHIRSNIRFEYLKSFDERLEKINELLKNPESRTAKTLSALSGLSVRRGLRLVRRFFLTITIPWIETNPKEDILIRCLYSYCNPTGLMNVDDNRITNLFVDKANRRLSLINLRILNIINEMKSRNITMHIGELVKHLRLFKYASYSSILNNLKYLLETRKRLIFLLDYHSLNCKIEDLLDAQIITTVAGSEYLNNLSIDLQYIQSCFESIEWETISNEEIQETINYLNNCKINSRFVPLFDNFISSKTIEELLPQTIDYSNIVERISFIRQALKMLVCKDMVESVNYRQNIHKLHDDITQIRCIDNLITIPIVTNIANAVYNILGRNIDNNIRTELLNWYNFIIIVHEWIRVIFPNNQFDKILSNLENKYETFQLTNN